MKHIYEAMLLLTPGIGRVKLKRLIEHFGNAQAVWSSKRQELAESGILGIKEIDVVESLRDKINAADIAKRWTQIGVQVCSLQDENYPALLRNIFDPPFLLFYRGCLHENSLCVAVVGSRRSTPYGRNVARSFSETMARTGVTIVSGAARGIDTEAHEGALAAGAATVAVLGCGVDIAYPAENSRLLEQIAVNGCVLSEYPPGTPPSSGHFPARNRIVAGMSVGVLVVEAREKSGALITADFALNENRDVYAIPGSVFSNASRGTHRLIQQGARLVSSAEDLLGELGLHNADSKNGTQLGLSVAEKKVLRELSHSEETSVDTLVMRLNMEASKIVVFLLQLEMAGYVVKDSVGYIRAAKE